MIFVTLYAVLSAVGFVVDLANHQWIAMLCVGILSAAAYRGGDDLYHTLTVRSFNQKFGRAVIALLLIALAFYLSNYPGAPGLYERAGQALGHHRYSHRCRGQCGSDTQGLSLDICE